MIFTNKEKKMTKIAPMYVYATEMVAPYYRKLNLEGKRVLTVVGSGDQVINALVLGAEEVVGFDINRNALYITELKIAAIKVLSYREFLTFFSQKETGFDYKCYHTSIRINLSRPCQKYFDNLYEKVGKKNLGISPYFRDRKFMHSAKKVREINAYLADAKAYARAREVLAHKKPRLLIENVMHLAAGDKLTGKKFDILNLSNIPNYLTGKSFGLTEEQSLTFFRTLKKLVVKGGSIFFYSFNPSVYPNSISKSVPPISDTPFRKKLVGSGAFKVIRKAVPGLNTEGPDHITILGC